MRIPLIGIALVAGAAMTANAQSRATLGAASKLWIEGTSNVHDWKAEASVINAEIELDPTAAAGKLVKSVNVVIPVKSLKSGHDKMDDNMRKALKAEQNPEIRYNLSSIEAVPGESKEAFTLKASGTLSIAGAQNAITMEIAATRLADGTIKGTGVVPVKMTAFGIKPPTAMLGAIRCGDEVKVKFDLVVGPKVIAAVDK